jgi:hypothetical protein
MLEHTNELEATTLASKVAENFINDFKTLGLSHITATACGVKSVEKILAIGGLSPIVKSFYKDVKKELLYNPIGNTDLIF